MGFCDREHEIPRTCLGNTVVHCFDQPYKNFVAGMIECSLNACGERKGGTSTTALSSPAFCLFFFSSKFNVDSFDVFQQEQCRADQLNDLHIMSKHSVSRVILLTS